MDFKIFRHNLAKYITDNGNATIEITPVEDFTLISINNVHVYAIPYGLLKYEALLEIEKQGKLTELLENTITGIGNSRFIVSRRKAVKELSNYANDEQNGLLVQSLIQVLNDNDSNEMLVEDYQALIKNAVEKAPFDVSDQYKEYLKFGRVLNPEIHKAVIPALIDLMKQLQKNGILDEMQDPQLMMKRYQEGQKKQ